MSKSALIRELALRTSWPETDQLPLTMYDTDENGEEVEIDVSDGGKYWLKFRDASGQQKMALQTTLWKQITRTDKNGVEYSEPSYDPGSFIDTMLRCGVLVGGVIPSVDEVSGDIVEFDITSKNRSQFVKMLPDKMLVAIVAMAIRFLYSDAVEQVVDDAKNLQGVLATTPDEAESRTTKKQSAHSQEDSGSLL